MATTVQQDRLEQRFALWDANHDGKIDQSDYDAEALRIVKAFGEPEASPKAQAVLKAYRGMWTYAAKQQGIAPDGALTSEQFMKLSSQAVIDGGDKGFSQVVRPSIQAVADLCDEDGDGQVDPDEFARWISAIGVDADAHDLFRRLDSDNSGVLSVDELVQAVRDYHEGRLDVPLLGK
jgi:Ca2+-binding EF-hand superfamily protein